MRRSFDEVPALDGFFWGDETLHARLGGVVYRLRVAPDEDRAAFSGPGIDAVIDWKRIEIVSISRIEPGVELDTALLWRMKAAWKGIYRAAVPSAVNPIAGVDRPPIAGPERG
jgi:hypothetical protein